jgi:hypothetical protein
MQFPACSFQHAVSSMQFRHAIASRAGGFPRASAGPDSVESSPHPTSHHPMATLFRCNRFKVPCISRGEAMSKPGPPVSMHRLAKSAAQTRFRHTRSATGAANDGTSIPMAKFARVCGMRSCELRNPRDTSKFMILMRFLDLALQCEFAAGSWSFKSTALGKYPRFHFCGQSGHLVSRFRSSRAVAAQSLCELRNRRDTSEFVILV